MSIRSLTALAVARDKASPSQPAMGGGGQAAIADDGRPALLAGGGPQQVPQQFSDVLISAIPSESLAAYTAVLGVAAGAIEATQQRAYLPFRWGTFIGFLLVTVLALAVSYQRKAKGRAGVTNPKSKRRFPLAEAVSALVAAAAWGLAMPGSALNAQLTGTVRTLTMTAIVVGAGAILTLVLGPQLKTGTSKPGDDPGGPGGPPQAGKASVSRHSAQVHGTNHSVAEHAAKG